MPDQRTLLADIQEVIAREGRVTALLRETVRVLDALIERYEADAGEAESGTSAGARVLDEVRAVLAAAREELR